MLTVARSFVAMQASFTYDDGASQSFTVTGNDDTFVFVNGQLAANLGGENALPALARAGCGTVSTGASSPALAALQVQQL